MSFESLNSLGGILSYPAASQVRSVETRQPPVATNQIIHDITRQNSLINTLEYQLLMYAIHLLFYPSALLSIARFKKSPQSCLATGHIKGCLPVGEFT